MFPMNSKHNREILKLVDDFEDLSAQGLPTFYDEREYLSLIEYYEFEEQFDKGLEVADHALKTFPYSVDFFLRKSELFIANKQVEEALNLLERASIFSPGEIEVALLKAEALARLDCFEEAFQILEELKEYAQGSNLSDIYVVEAMIYENQEQFERMFYSLKAALKETPNHKESLERLGLCIELSKNYEESVLIHEEILDADPYSYLAWYNLGHAHAYLGDYRDAIEALEFAFVINEKFEEAYRDCAELCFEIQDYKKSLKYYLEVLENFEPDSDLFMCIGECYQRLGKYQKARTFYTRSNHLDPLNDEVYFHIGECFAKEDKWKSALNSYKKALNIEDKREEYFAAVAQAYYHLGQFEFAEINYQRAIDIAPDQAQSWVFFATYLMENGRGNEAISMLESADDYAVGIELLYCRIACLFSVGKRQEAYYWLGEALIEDFAMHKSLFEFLPELEQDEGVTNLISAYMA